MKNFIYVRYSCRDNSYVCMVSWTITWIKSSLIESSLSPFHYQRQTFTFEYKIISNIQTSTLLQIFNTNSTPTITLFNNLENIYFRERLRLIRRRKRRILPPKIRVICELCIRCTAYLRTFYKIGSDLHIL